MYHRPDDQPVDVAALLLADQAREHRLQTVAMETARESARREAKREVDEEEGQLRRLTVTPATHFEVRRTHWLWRDRVPVGGLGLIAGKGDVSKSTLFAQMAAWITTGDMKGEYYGTPRNVLYVVNEDSIEETVKPRLMAHGADLTRVYFVGVETPLGAAALSLPGDESRLREAITSHDIVCTFIDPLSANVSGRKNDQKDMRDTFQAVNTLAEVTHSCILGLAHTRKEGASDVATAVMGSSEQVNVARSLHGLVMDKEEDDARILSCEKLNQGKRHLLKSLRFTLESVNIPCTNGDWQEAPRIMWLAEVDDTASDQMNDQLNGHSGVDDCAEWLRSYVMNNGGEVAYRDIRRVPEAKRYSDSMLTRARKKAGLRSRREQVTPPYSVWYLPMDPL